MDSLFPPTSFNDAELVEGCQGFLNCLSRHVDLRFSCSTSALPIHHRKDHTQQQPLFPGKFGQKGGI